MADVKAGEVPSILGGSESGDPSLLQILDIIENKFEEDVKTRALRFPDDEEFPDIKERRKAIKNVKYIFSKEGSNYGYPCEIGEKKEIVYGQPLIMSTIATMIEEIKDESGFFRKESPTPFGVEVKMTAVEKRGFITVWAYMNRLLDLPYDDPRESVYPFTDFLRWHDPLLYISVYKWLLYFGVTNPEDRLLGHLKYNSYQWMGSISSHTIGPKWSHETPEPDKLPQSNEGYPASKDPRDIAVMKELYRFVYPYGQSNPSYMKNIPYNPRIDEMVGKRVSTAI
jgi:hypothetical protein